MVFDHWSIHKNIRFSSQNFPSDKTAGVFSRTFIVKNMSNSLTYTVASSCVCTSPLAVMTIVGLHDFVTVSISASLKSFFADRVHWRVRVDNKFFPQIQKLMQASTHFPKVRRMLLFLAPLISTHFWAASTPLRGHLALATPSPPETDPQILERWGYAHEVMRFTWANISERRILVSNFSMTRNSLSWISHVGLVSACLSSSVD